jgi:hypothetical protein
MAADENPNIELIEKACELHAESEVLETKALAADRRNDETARFRYSRLSDRKKVDAWETVDQAIPELKAHRQELVSEIEARVEKARAGKYEGASTAFSKRMEDHIKRSQDAIDTFCKPSVS